jgi:hypothetical protein
MASTWAGWAVSAVTSKFYKSQSSQISDQSPALPASTQGPAATSNPISCDTIPETSHELRRTSYTESTDESVQWGDMNVLRNDLNIFVRVFNLSTFTF